MPIPSSVHPCDQEEQGGCEHNCVKQGSNFKCNCNEGFKLSKDGKKCEKGLLQCLLLVSRFESFFWYICLSILQKKKTPKYPKIFH